MYLGAKATDNGDGTWHYEYALYNRDNNRGAARLRIPVSPGANVTNLGMQDLDSDPFNNWLYSVSPGEVSWSTGAHPQPWNTIYNFYFDANIPPAANQGLTIGFFGSGGLGEQVPTANLAPVDPIPTPYCQGKQNSLGCVPFISTTGSASASSTAAFSVRASDVVPNEFGFLLYGVHGRLNLNFHNGKLCVKAPLVRLLPPKNSGSSGAPPCTGELMTNFNNRIQNGVDPALIPGQRVERPMALPRPGPGGRLQRRSHQRDSSSSSRPDPAPRAFDRRPAAPPGRGAPSCSPGSCAGQPLCPRSALARF